MFSLLLPTLAPSSLFSSEHLSRPRRDVCDDGVKMLRLPLAFAAGACFKCFGLLQPHNSFRQKQYILGDQEKMNTPPSLITVQQACLFALALFAGAAFAQDDELVCFQGFVMDTYCIELGNLLDAPSVESLRNPELHSYHCLVDVTRCVEGGYEMLADVRESSGGLYGRFLRLDATGNEQVIALARATGNPSAGCTTCSGTLGNEAMGFQATVVGTIVPNSGSPQLFATQEVLPYADGCPEGMAVVAPEADDLSFDAGSAQSTILTHGSLMLVSWGFLLPLGVITARFLRHRPNGLWFKMHRVMQLLGLILALVGWSIALANFTVLETGVGSGSSEERKAYAHAVCGTIAMCIGLLQPLNAFFRPHAPEGDEKKPTSRFLWELVHKGMGYIGTILALVTIGLGTRIALGYESQFLAGFIASLVLLTVIAFIMIVDKIRYNKTLDTADAKPTTDERPSSYVGNNA